MDQLDLFSSLPKPPAPKKKEAINAEEPAMTDEKVHEAAVEDVKDEKVFEHSHMEQPFLVAKDEVEFKIEDQQHKAGINTVQFEDPPGANEAEAPVTIEFEDEKALPKPKPQVGKDGRILQKRGRKSFKEMNAEVDLIEIPEDEILYKKQYYAISEVAGWFKVNTSLLRFWETEFDILKPRKNRKGDRLFRPEDVKNLQLIYHLLRDRKYTIDGAKDYLNGHKTQASAQFQITQTLQKFKSFLLELKANLQ